MKRIYLVDDDAAMLRSLTRLLRVEGYDVVPFESPRDFLQSFDNRTAACVITDLKMPEMTGLEMYQAMENAGVALPVIFLTGQGGIPDSVLAMKRGATNFLTKPAGREELLSAIDEAFIILGERAEKDAENSELQHRFATLTPREAEVCLKVVQGLLNKQIAGELGTAEKTIKVHRARVMEKMKAESVAELVRMVDRVRVPSPAASER